MTTVFFNPNGGALAAVAVLPPTDVAVADYEMILRESGSNSSTTLLSGDNLNLEDDVASLPSPVGLNHGRRVKLETGFVGMNIDQNPDYVLRLEIWQDGQRLGFDEESGKLTGAGQFSLLFVMLASSDNIV